MARIRSVKPALRTSEKVNSWPIELRFFWIMLWGYCDDYGRGHDNARLIKADAFPLDDEIPAERVGRWMDALELAEVIARYEADGKRYFYVPNWTEHQKVQHPSKSDIPSPFPEAHEGLMRVAEGLTPEGEGEVEGEKEVGAIAPPRKCPKHLNDRTSPNCFACRDARLEREDWDKAQKNKLTSVTLPPRDKNAGMCVVHANYPMPCVRCAEEAA